MNETLDQHGAHSPPMPPSGWRHAAHSGGKGGSSTTPRPARPDCARRAKPGPGAAGVPDAGSGGEEPRFVADVEALPFASGALDLVVSAFALQTVNDLPGVLIQIRRALKPDGLFLAALLGGETLAELRESLAVAESELTGG